MKNIILILLLSFVAFSCSKEDNNHEPKPNFPEKLLGKWKMTDCVVRNDSGVGVTSPCDIQTTKNIYDMWFKNDGLYSSKTNYPCEDCKYAVEEIETHKGYFEITFNPEIECIGSCRNTAVILNLSDTELILTYASSDFGGQDITYTRVE